MMGGKIPVEVFTDRDKQFTQTIYVSPMNTPMTGRMHRPLWKARKHLPQDLQFFPKKALSTVDRCAAKIKGVKKGLHLINRARICVGCDLFIPMPFCRFCGEQAPRLRKALVEFYYVRTKKQVKAGVERVWGKSVIRMCKKCREEVSAVALLQTPRNTSSKA